MKKYYCDICKEETENATEYKLPIRLPAWDNVTVTAGAIENHIKYNMREEITAQNYNLCFNCRETIGNFIGNIISKQ